LKGLIAGYSQGYRKCYCVAIVKDIVKVIEKAKGSFFDILKRNLEKLENKNSFKKKRDVLKTTQKHLRVKREYSRLL
jgi:hypothetical protein